MLFWHLNMEAGAVECGADVSGPCPCCPDAFAVGGHAKCEGLQSAHVTRS